MISSCANADLDGILHSEVQSVPHSAHDYSQENAVPFQNLSKAAKRRRRRKLQKSFKRSQEILVDDMENEESILEPSEKQYPKSMVTHWEYSVDNEKGGIMTSAVGHQTINWAEEMESVDNTDRETIKDAGVLETEDITSETPQFLSLNDEPVSPN